VEKEKEADKGELLFKFKAVFVSGCSLYTKKERQRLRAFVSSDIRVLASEERC